MKDTVLSGWQCFSEHWIGGKPISESRSIREVTESLRFLGIEPAEMERIREAILKAINDSKRSEDETLDSTALLVRLWFPNVALEDSQTMVENPSGRRIVSCGLGFFLIEKKVGDRDSPWKMYCRMVDVLVFGKSYR